MNILYDEEIDGVLHKVDRADLLAELCQRLPDLLILDRAEDLHPYECDGLAAYRTLPLLVVLPECLEQVETILRICHARGVPVVARGAGTGLSGGALPLAQGVLLVVRNPPPAPPPWSASAPRRHPPPASRPRSWRATGCCTPPSAWAP